MLVLKEATEVREVVVPPLVLTADGRTLEEPSSIPASVSGAQGELALALALQVSQVSERFEDLNESHY